VALSSLLTVGVLLNYFMSVMEVDENLMKSCEQWRKRLKLAVETDSWDR
jgi:hypothetical protein